MTSEYIVTTDSFDFDSIRFGVLDSFSFDALVGTCFK